MPRVIRFAVAATVTTLLGAMACSNGDRSVTEPSNQLDVAALLAAAASGEPSAYPTGAPAIALPVPSTAVLGGCTYSAANQRFDCAPRTILGLTYKSSYYLLAADGTSLSTPDASKVAALRTVFDVTGTIISASAVAGVKDSMSVNHHDDLTLSGLLTGNRTENGTSTDHDFIVFDINGTRTTDKIDTNGRTTNLVLTTGSRYPTSGTIATDATTTANFGSTPTSFTIHSALTFNGTSTVTLVTTIDDESTPVTCHIDLVNFTTTCS